MRLDDPAAASWVTEAPIEERIVTYADKRATQRVVSLEKRFERWQRKHPEYRERLASALLMARLLESTLCEQIGIRPARVERLRWVEDAMARAEASGALVIADTAISEHDLRVGGAIPPDPTAAA